MFQALDMSVNGSHEWRSIASMSTRRSSVGVGVLGGLIYAVGRLSKVRKHNRMFFKSTLRSTVGVGLEY
jgi:hypothetical protein